MKKQFLALIALLAINMSIHAMKTFNYAQYTDYRIPTAGLKPHDSFVITNIDTTKMAAAIILDAQGNPFAKNTHISAPRGNRYTKTYKVLSPAEIAQARLDIQRNPQLAVSPLGAPVAAVVKAAAQAPTATPVYAGATPDKTPVTPTTTSAPTITTAVTLAPAPVLAPIELRRATPALPTEPRSALAKIMKTSVSEPTQKITLKPSAPALPAPVATVPVIQTAPDAPFKTARMTVAPAPLVARPPASLVPATPALAPSARRALPKITQAPATPVKTAPISRTPITPKMPTSTLVTPVFAPMELRRAMPALPTEEPRAASPVLPPSGQAEFILSERSESKGRASSPALPAEPRSSPAPTQKITFKPSASVLPPAEPRPATPVEPRAALAKIIQAPRAPVKTATILKTAAAPKIPASTLVTPAGQKPRPASPTLPAEPRAATAKITQAPAVPLKTATITTVPAAAKLPAPTRITPVAPMEPRRAWAAEPIAKPKETKTIKIEVPLKMDTSRSETILSPDKPVAISKRRGQTMPDPVLALAEQRPTARIKPRETTTTKLEAPLKTTASRKETILLPDEPASILKRRGQPLPEPLKGAAQAAGFDLQKLTDLERDVQRITATSAFASRTQPAKIGARVEPIAAPAAPLLPPQAPVIPAVDPIQMKPYVKAIESRNLLEVQNLLKGEPKPSKEIIKKAKEEAEDALNATEYKQDTNLEFIIHYLNQALKE